MLHQIYRLLIDHIFIFYAQNDLMAVNKERMIIIRIRNWRHPNTWVTSKGKFRCSGSSQIYSSIQN